MACVNVPFNNPTGWSGYTNTVDFINTTLASLSILSMQAYNNSPENCETEMQGNSQSNDTFRIQYRDGDIFTFTIQFSDTAHGITTAIYQVQNGNVTISYVNSPGIPQIDLPTCNDNIYCLTEPSDSPTINGATIEGPCPMPPIGEACEVTPRIGEPGFSTKNCDPKKVIDVKCKFADSVYAQFKRARYGIDTCCEFDLDKIDIKNQLIDLGFIYDPDLCVDGTPLPEGCCLQPCDADANLIINLAAPCPAPTDPVITIAVPIPPIPDCIELRFFIADPTLPASATGTDCCGIPFNITLIAGVPSPAVCMDINKPYSFINADPSTTGPCDCCPEPTNPGPNEGGPIKGIIGIN